MAFSRGSLGTLRKVSDTGVPPSAHSTAQRISALLCKGKQGRKERERKGRGCNAYGREEENVRQARPEGREGGRGGDRKGGRKGGNCFPYSSYDYLETRESEVGRLFAPPEGGGIYHPVSQSVRSARGGC